MSTLLVFRNNLSHGRYNEARLVVGMLKNALRGMYQEIHVCVTDLDVLIHKDAKSADVELYREKSLTVLRHIMVLCHSVVACPTCSHACTCVCVSMQLWCGVRICDCMRLCGWLCEVVCGCVRLYVAV